jgi:hypothetical protein
MMQDLVFAQLTRTVAALESSDLASRRQVHRVARRPTGAGSQRARGAGRNLLAEHFSRLQPRRQIIDQADRRPVSSPGVGERADAVMDGSPTSVGGHRTLPRQILY